MEAAAERVATGAVERAAADWVEVEEAMAAAATAVVAVVEMVAVVVVAVMAAVATAVAAVATVVGLETDPRPFESSRKRYR